MGGKGWKGKKEDTKKKLHHNASIFDGMAYLFDLTGKTALVTGGARGLGFSMSVGHYLLVSLNLRTLLPNLLPPHHCNKLTRGILQQDGSNTTTRDTYYCEAWLAVHTNSV